MCEPYHSINQFEDHDPESPRAALGLMGKIRAVGTKIRSWLHFSKVGAGHSEALAKGLQSVLDNLRGTRWEVGWWDRSVKIDGDYYGELDPVGAEIACGKYANLSSIGHIQIFRRWFEPTLAATNRGNGYISAFRSMLTKEGRTQFEAKIRHIGGPGLVRSLTFWSTHELDPRVIKAMLGMTRKRELLVPEWADDDKLWAPISQDKESRLILPATV